MDLQGISTTLRRRLQHLVKRSLADFPVVLITPVPARSASPRSSEPSSEVIPHVCPPAQRHRAYRQGVGIAMRPELNGRKARGGLTS